MRQILFEMYQIVQFCKVFRGSICHAPKPLAYCVMQNFPYTTLLHKSCLRSDDIESTLLQSKL